jgi:hypothetical protein
VGKVAQNDLDVGGESRRLDHLVPFQYLSLDPVVRDRVVNSSQAVKDGTRDAHNPDAVVALSAALLNPDSAGNIDPLRLVLWHRVDRIVVAE